MTYKSAGDMTRRVALRCGKYAGSYSKQIICRLFACFLFLVAIESPLQAEAKGQDNHAHDHSSVVESGQVQPTNSYCPVMPDMKVNPDMYSDYKGKRVYFCCANCRAAFERDPEKYLVLLPQFGGSITHADHDQPGYRDGFTLIRLTKPMGVATLSLLVLTVLAGLFRRKAPKLLFKWHKRLGVTTVVFAIIHAILVVATH